MLVCGRAGIWRRFNQIKGFRWCSRLSYAHQLLYPILHIKPLYFLDALVFLLMRATGGVLALSFEKPIFDSLPCNKL